MNLLQITGFWSVVLIALVTAYLVYFVSTFLVILFDNSSPTKAISWILVITFLPVFGLIIYGWIGKNYRRIKMFSRKGLRDIEQMAMIAGRREVDLSGRSILDKKEAREKYNIIRLLVNNNKALLTRHNRILVLENGEATFTAIIPALESATHHIHLEYYIIESDKIGNRIKDILIKKARAGIEVRLIYDAFGSWGLKKSYLRELREAGVEVNDFLPVHFPLFGNPFNYRNHRKIIVVDGFVGFVGGLNIGDRYLESSSEVGFWRDTHLRLEGDAARGLQSLFLTDWYFCSKEKVLGPAYFPDHDVAEEHLVQITSSGPDSDWASIMQAYFAAISTAKERVFIATPYFIPNESISTALKTAALSGVDVRLLIPERSDSSILTYSLFSYIEEFLRAGVKVYAYQKGFNHGKLMMVDGVFASVGTANLDIRSFDQNFEVNALLYDEEATHQLERRFLKDLENSQQLELKIFMQRPRLQKLKEALARLFSPLL